MTGTTCERCGRVHPRCKAHNRAGGPCGQPPQREQQVCHLHGGRTPAAVAGAERRALTRKVEADITAALAHEALAPVGDPLEVLSMVTSEVLAMKGALAARVNALSSLSYESTATGTEQLRAEVALYERALDRSGKFLDLLAKSGIEERRVRLAEDQGLLVAGVISRALQALFDGLQAAGVVLAVDVWGALVSEIVPRELRALEAGTS